MNKLSKILVVSATAILSLTSEITIAKEPISKEPRLHTDDKPGLKCIQMMDRQTIRDAIDYPGAYEFGYQQGIAARGKGASMQPPSDGGELARGYGDGYQFKPYAGQATTVPTENKVTCGCRTRILKDVVFLEDIEATCKPSRQEIYVSKSDAYHADAYSDGYREGTASKAKRETYQARSAGGEFARGFEDGYFGRRNTGQRYTELPVKDYSCNCRLIIKRNNLDTEY
ncbi:hypothetical protein [Chamaesiphon sp. VAR_48_metabat_403]|uniref:hypothetical protein n=1 Tax=Chamaesiphon sp. VAR_48_metabat_403 TaxID=2964700 RepID=UPI00286E4DB9|nr:hypothetical protein [Chamaesiphon sp. VAR_48_metabat_403]